MVDVGDNGDLVGPYALVTSEGSLPKPLERDRPRPKVRDASVAPAR
jgi:hypothetical protein